MSNWVHRCRTSWTSESRGSPGSIGGNCLRKACSDAEDRGFGMARTLAPRPRWFERFLRPYWADEATRGTYLRNTILFAFVVFMLSMVYSAIADNLLEQILGTR